MTGTIQGQDAVLSFYTNDWIPFVCSSDISVTITANKAQVRTAGDGHWKKYSYQDTEYAITLSGVLKFDDANFTGWDMIDNMLNFNNILFRCSFDDQNGDVKTIQGYCMIETTTIGWSQGNLVKNDFQLQGTGKLDIFDGLIPCPTVITTITVDGEEADDGIVHISYTYTGDSYQVKYRIDGTGDYAYALGAAVIDVPGLSVGDHSVEIIPVCLNGYEGTGLIQDFIVTRALICTSAITAINIAGGAATNISTGAATQMKYRIDGGTWVMALITDSIPVGTLAVGNHTIEEVPVCSNGVSGTGFVKNFTISVQPAQSIINYLFIFSGLPAPLTTFNIYVNGILSVSSSSPGSGSLSAPLSATITATISCGNSGKHMRMQVSDQTTSTALFDQTKPSPDSVSYLFTTNGDTYFISQTISD